jgi:xylulokinase
MERGYGNMRILALDVGTTSVKAAVLDVATATPVGPIAHVGYELDTPVPDAAVIPAERLWTTVTAAARAAVRQAGVAGVADKDVQAVGLSCLMPALILLDTADRPLGPIWTHLDRRARPAARQVWAAVGEEFLATVGNRPLPGGITAVSYRQQLNDDPYLGHRVASYLHANGWLGLRLTGQRAFDPANACFTGLFGTLTDQAWSPRWTDYFEVDPSWLPPVISGNATLGTLRAEAAAELGVAAGLPVKLGTADTSSAMLAADMHPGDLLHEVGTTQVLSVLTDAPKPSPQRLTRLLGVGAAFIHVTHNPVGGVALEWIRNLCFGEQSEQEFFERTIPAAMGRRTRVTLDPPFLGGDRLEIEAHRAAFRDLELTTDRLDLLAAVLEAMARRHRTAVAALGVGDRFERIFLTGGGAAVVRALLPSYQAANVHLIEEGSLRGVARLFHGESR